MKKFQKGVLYIFMLFISVNTYSQSKNIVLNWFRQNGYTVIEDVTFKLKKNESAKVEVSCKPKDDAEYRVAAYSLDKDIYGISIRYLDGISGNMLYSFYNNNAYPITGSISMNNQRQEPYPLVYEIVNEDAKKSEKKIRLWIYYCNKDG
jgi:hypothetical protein